MVTIVTNCDALDQRPDAVAAAAIPPTTEVVGFPPFGS